MRQCIQETTQDIDVSPRDPKRPDKGLNTKYTPLARRPLRRESCSPHRYSFASRAAKTWISFEVFFLKLLTAPHNCSLCYSAGGGTNPSAVTPGDPGQLHSRPKVAEQVSSRCRTVALGCEVWPIWAICRPTWGNLEQVLYNFDACLAGFRQCLAQIEEIGSRLAKLWPTLPKLRQLWPTFDQFRGLLVGVWQCLAGIVHFGPRSVMSFCQTWPNLDQVRPNLAISAKCCQTMATCGKSWRTLAG